MLICVRIGCNVCCRRVWIMQMLLRLICAALHREVSAVEREALLSRE